MRYNSKHSNTINKTLTFKKKSKNDYTKHRDANFLL